MTTLKQRKTDSSSDRGAIISGAKEGEGHNTSLDIRDVHGSQDFASRISDLETNLNKQISETGHISDLVKAGWIIILLMVVALFTDVIFYKRNDTPKTLRIILEEPALDIIRQR